MDYVFYFDETFHDRKISAKPDGIINTFGEDKNDCYIGTFWGCQQKELQQTIDKLSDFETKHKNKFALSRDQELKSQIIKPKNFQFGIKSFSHLTLEFYEDLFMLLQDIHPIIQIDAISKVEIMLRSVFNCATLPPYVNSISFFYSLTKFFVLYQPKEVIAQMAIVHDQKSAEQFRLKLIDTLDMVVDATKNIQRKQEESHAFSQLSLILEDTVFEKAFAPKVDFIYLQNFDGLSRLLNEKNIPLKRVKVVIDREANTFSAAQQFHFGKTAQADSNNNIQLRLADQICGFLGKMFRALSHDPSLKEEVLTDIHNINQKALEDKRLLSREWFEIDERRYALYVLVFKVLIANCQEYWTAMTASYSDQVSVFYSLLRYYSSYYSYEEYINIKSSEHIERFNSCCVQELSRVYSIW